MAERPIYVKRRCAICGMAWGRTPVGNSSQWEPTCDCPGRDGDAPWPDIDVHPDGAANWPTISEAEV